MSTILIGVDASARSEDAIAFGRRLAAVSSAHVVVACAFPYNDAPSRASNAAYRQALADDAEQTARDMRDRLDGIAADRLRIRITRQPLARARPARPRGSRARRAHRRRLLPHRPSRPGRAGQHRRAAAARRTVRRRDRPARLPHARRTADPPDRRRLRRLRRGDRRGRRGGRAGPRARRRARDHRRRRPRDLRGLRHDGRRRALVTLREDIERCVQDDLDAVIAGLPERHQGRERPARRRPGRPARRAQRRPRPDARGLARLRPAALRARRRRQRPADAHASTAP